MFTPSRLTLARQHRGLTLTKLAEQSGVSPRSLTYYESGKFPPSDETLAKLADALAVPLSFFGRDEVDPIPPEAASFRKLSKTTAIRRDAVLATASLTTEFFALVASRFKLPTADVPTFDKLSPKSAAELVRHRWNLGDRPISNMLHLLELKGVRVAPLGHNLAEIDAFCFYRDGTPYAFLNTSKSGERQRFDAAHELGHLVLHNELEMNPDSSKEREAEANDFAAAFLMPSTAVIAQSMRGASLERILAARTYWKVSAMALTHRLHELRLLNDWQYRTTCIALSDLGYRSHEPGGIVPETSQVLRKVMFSTSSKITIRDAADGLDLYAPDVREFVRDLVPVAA